MGITYYIILCGWYYLEPSLKTKEFCIARIMRSRESHITKIKLSQNKYLVNFNEL